jgi:hypothetical protein
MDGRRLSQGAPAPYAFVNRVYKRNLRPVVISTGMLSALWTLLWAITLFQEIGIAQDNNFPKLATFSLVLGVMYMVTCLIEVFGIVAAVTQRLPLIRVYALASVLSCLTVIAAGLMGVVVHFVYKSDLINECTKVATGENVDYRFGWFGPSVHETLNASDAADFCQDGWDHDSWSEVVALLIEAVLGVLFSAIAFAYYHQSRDPSSVINAFRSPSSQVRGGAYPQHYNPPYNSSVPNLAYGVGPSAYAPPPGPPPPFTGAGYSAEDLGKPPGYDGGDYGSKFGPGKDFKEDSKDSKDDPFADFEGTSGRGERDVTSRPRPGDHDEFQV